MTERQDARTRPLAHAGPPPRLAVAAIAALLGGCLFDSQGGSGGASGPFPPPPAPVQALPPAAPNPPAARVTPPPPALVTISGRIAYENVPQGTRGLDYARTAAVPARGVTVHALSFDRRSVLAATRTDANGEYSVAVPSLSTVVIRAWAERVPEPGQGPELRVVDNTRAGATHFVETPSFESGTAAQRRDLVARTGWDGTRYATPRDAAPFALLDSAERIAAFVRTLDPAALPAMAVHWSPRNRPELGAGSAPDFATGRIGRTHAVPGTAGAPFALYVLGAADVDTDEYDPEVLGAEVGRWYLRTYGRSDAFAVPAATEERLDARLAFAEAWPRAFAGWATGSNRYRNSSGPRQAGGESLDLESNATANAGWYSPAAVARALHDLADGAGDAGDATQLPPAALHAGVLALATSAAPATIHAYAAALQDEPANAAAVGATLATHGIRSTAGDPFGDGETNDGGNARNLPLAPALGLLESRVVCSDAAGTAAVPVASATALGPRRFARVVLTADASVTIEATEYAPVDPNATPDPNAAPVPRPPVDPELVLWGRGVEVARGGTAGGTERLAATLAAGTYLLEVHERTNVSGTSPRGETCFSVAVGP